MLTRRRLLGLLAAAPLAGPALVKAASAPKAQQSAPKVHELAVKLHVDDSEYRAGIEAVSRGLDRFYTNYAALSNKVVTYNPANLSQQERALLDRLTPWQGVISGTFD